MLGLVPRKQENIPVNIAIFKAGGILLARPLGEDAISF